MAELREKLGAWRESVGAVMPRPNPEYEEGAEPSIPRAGQATRKSP